MANHRGMKKAAAPKTEKTERSPIVVIMGHIDHGKSTLLDYIRKSNIVAGEAGGITQHLSAYEVLHKSTAGGAEKRITFLDTPGHEAFRGMRSRGAHVADVAILVVSAEDGVKPQTIEAHQAIVAAAVPYIVAINKIDKPNANVDRTKQSLAEAGIFVEGYGGDVPWAPISAKEGQGIPELLDTLLLVAEMAELSMNAEHPAEGVIIEANMDPKKGVSATLVLTDGSIAKGTYAVAEDAWTPVRIMENFLGKPIDAATASAPVRLTGWSRIPKVGAKVTIVGSKKEAEELAQKAETSPVQAFEDAIPGEERAILPLVIKTDVLGTLEAIEHELTKLTHDRVKLKVLSKGVGAIGESDIKMLVGSKHPIAIGFHTKADAMATDLAREHNVPIKTFDIIYKLTEWLAEEMDRAAPKREVEETIGELKVIRVFSQQKDKQVIGGRVISGKIQDNAKFKIMRRETEVGEGEITELQSQKIRAKEVLEGTECGLSVESKISIAERDVLVSYIIVTK